MVWEVNSSFISINLSYCIWSSKLWSIYSYRVPLYSDITLSIISWNLFCSSFHNLFSFNLFSFFLIGFNLFRKFIKFFLSLFNFYLSQSLFFCSLFCCQSQGFSCCCISLFTYFKSYITGIYFVLLRVLVIWSFRLFRFFFNYIYLFG